MSDRVVRIIVPLACWGHGCMAEHLPHLYKSLGSVITMRKGASSGGNSPGGLPGGDVSVKTRRASIVGE